MNKQEKREVPTYYGILPAEVRYSEVLSPMEKIMYSEITALANKTGKCWATNQYFADLYHVQATTVSDWINGLNKAGFVNITGAKAKKRVITLISILRKKPKKPSEKPEGEPSGKVEHNNTSINNKNNTTQDELVDVNFNSKEYFTNLMKSNDVPLSIIGYYTLKKGNYKDISNSKQASAVIGRNMKVAKRLSVFEKTKISKAIDDCQNTVIGGRPMNYTLETVEKFLLK